MDSNEKHNYIEYLLDCRNRRRTASRFQYVDVDTWILFTLQPRDNAAIIKFALCFSFKQFIWKERSLLLTLNTIRISYEDSNRITNQILFN